MKSCLKLFNKLAVCVLLSLKPLVLRTRVSKPNKVNKTFLLVY